MRYLVYIWQLVFFLALFSSQTLLAQEVAEQPSAETVKKEDAFQIKNLSKELEKQTASLAGVDKLLNSKFLKEIAAQLKDLEADSEKVVTEAQAVFGREAHLLNRQDLNRVENLLLVHQKKVAAVRDVLNEKIKAVSDFERRLSERQALWEKTLAEIDKDDTYVVAKKRTKTAQDEIITAKTKLRAYLDEALRLDEDLAALAESAAAKLADLEPTLVRFREALLSTDTTPLYSFEFWKMASSFSLSLFWDSVVEQFDLTLGYFTSNSKLVLLHVVLFFLIAWLVFKTRSTSFVKEAFPKLYDNPILITVTSGLLLSWLIYDQADPRLFNLVGLLLVPPLVLFFRELLERQYTLIVYGTAVLFLCDQLRGVLGDFPAASQLVFLFELLWGAYLARSFVVECDCLDRNDAEKGTTSLIWFFGQLGRFSSVFLCVAAILLCVGYYRLVLFAGETAFSAVYVALLFFAIHRLSSGLVSAILHSTLLIGLRVVAKHQEAIARRLEQGIAFIFIALWVIKVLHDIGIKEKVFETGRSLLSAGFEVGGQSLSLGGVLFGAFVIYLGIKLSRGIREFLEEDVFNRRDVDAGIKSTIDTAVHWAVLLIALFAGLSSIGIGFENFALIAGALSVGIGFGLQNIVNNFVSGIILLVERPIKVSDLILVGETLGNVTRIGMRSSTIRTLDEAEIIIPNSNLVTESVINWTLTSRRARISVAVGVKYGTDVEFCMKVLKETLQNEPYILDFPQPSVLFKEFADSSLNFELRGWIKNFQEHQELKSTLAVAVSRALADNDITIPFPQRDVHLIPPSGGSKVLRQVEG